MRRWLMLLVWTTWVHAVESPRCEPSFLRLDLQPQQVQTVTLMLVAPPGTQAAAAIVDCACLKVESPLPAVVDATGRWELRLRVTGMRPGVEDIQIANSAGTARAQIQIVGPGAGRGHDQLAAALDNAAGHGWAMWGVVSALAGQTRHCSCALGSLGGIDRLAALPRLATTLRPGVATRWILSGDSEGKRSGVAAALAPPGWSNQASEIRISANPLPLLGQPGITAIIPTVPVAVQHRRILRPVLTGGLAVELLLVDGQGQIQEHRTMPVDDSLPADGAILAGFPDVLTSRIDVSAQPSAACAGCHASAQEAWSRSRHAHALDSLKPEDRTDACIGCHTTAVAERVLAPAVHCQACHAGADQHAVSNGTVRTTGTADCRSCHDAQHNPGFQREAGWSVIRHGRDVTKP